jgi:hypothetical protein
MPGDRLSNCGSRMEPIGLTLKNSGRNKYAQSYSGEVMLVHYCLTCGKISCNRIAGDDNAYSVLNLLKNWKEPEMFVLAKLDELNIQLLSPSCEAIVSRAMLGNNYSFFYE